MTDTALRSGAHLHHLTPEARARQGDDPIFALNAEAKRRAAAGENVINATLGSLQEDDGKLAVMPVVFEALAAVDPVLAASYAPISGPPDFLAAVIDDCFHGSSLAAAATAAATPGGTGALHHAIVDLLEPGQALLTPEYYWGPYKTLADHTRRRVETHRMFDARGRFDVEALEPVLQQQLAAQGRALLLLNTPCNNPTGYSLDADDWRALGEVLTAGAERGPVSLLVDLAYGHFGRGPAPQRAWVPHVEALAQRVQVLVAWTASKAFAQYGARVGALVAVVPDADERKRTAAALGFSCRGTWSNCNHLGMLAVTSLLREPRLAARANTERDRLRALLDARVAAFNDHARRANLRFPRYEGGFFVTLACAEPLAVAAALRERGVFVVPIGGAVRVALCSTPVAAVPRLVAALGECVQGG